MDLKLALMALLMMGTAGGAPAPTAEEAKADGVAERAVEEVAELTDIEIVAELAGDGVGD